MVWFQGRNRIKTSRLLTAAILLPILFAIIWFLPSFFFFLFICLLIFRVQYEFYRLFYDPTEKKPISLGLSLGLWLAGIFYFKPGFAGIALMLFLVIILLYTLFNFEDIRKTTTESAILFMGIAYLPAFLSHLFLIRDLPEGRGLIVLVLLMTWGGDAGAYYVGRAFGKKKLCPRVSPNKTIAGAVGGLITTFSTGIIAKLTFLAFLSWGDVVALALLLGIFGQLGDLCESMLKRAAGVKDSSAIIPSHGGLFDKLDSVSFAAPLLYYYMAFLP
ncbi:MAG: CDP-archaeol synthase [Nitrospirota bacterium]|nr:CDP-archaeol synthase [Nitrospirota bacterium]